MPTPPTSIIDPFAPEPDETEPVICLLTLRDKTQRLVVGDRRLLEPNAVLRVDDRVFTHRGDTERNLDGKRARFVRLYTEAPIVDITDKAQPWPR